MYNFKHMKKIIKIFLFIFNLNSTDEYFQNESNKFYFNDKEIKLDNILEKEVPTEEEKKKK